MSALNYVVVSAALVFGNYFYQFLRLTPDWGTATERSFFQAWAILVVFILTNVASAKS